MDKIHAERSEVHSAKDEHQDKSDEGGLAIVARQTERRPGGRRRATEREAEGDREGDDGPEGRLTARGHRVWTNRTSRRSRVSGGRVKSVSPNRVIYYVKPIKCSITSTSEFSVPRWQG
jgi:hypothetical protein